MYGRCHFTMSCNMSHNKEQAPLCRLWQKGLCIGATGNACPMRHYYNEMDGAMMQAARAVMCPRVENNQLEKYNSPYRVKVIKEVSKQRMEEVDLETGKRKSWIETTEFEVLDLTGETPVKKTLQQVTASPLSEVTINKDAGGAGKAKKQPTALLASASTTNPGTCPVCGKGFKGERGVKSHRRAKNSACHPGKENPAVTTPASSVEAPTVAPAQDQDDSVILVPDTPVPGGNRIMRVSRRGSYQDGLMSREFQ